VNGTRTASAEDSLGVLAMAPRKPKDRFAVKSVLAGARVRCD
jgi:hypothetical protein